MPKKKDLTLHTLLTRGFQEEHEFSAFIEREAARKHLTIMEALIEYCEHHDIDPVAAAGLITEELRSKIYVESKKLHLVKK